MAGSKQVRQEGSLQPQDGAADRRSQAQNKRERERAARPRKLIILRGKNWRQLLGKAKSGRHKSKSFLSAYSIIQEITLAIPTQKKIVMSASKMSVEHGR